MDILDLLKEVGIKICWGVGKALYYVGKFLVYSGDNISRIGTNDPEPPPPPPG